MRFDNQNYETGEDVDTGAQRRRRPPPPRPAQVHRRGPPPQYQQQRQGPPRKRLGMGAAANVQVTEKGENRAGLMLKSASTAGNAGITAYTGQTTSQHEFLCVAVEVSVPVANDPALATDTPVYAEFSDNPKIKGLPFMDGALVIKGNDSRIIPLANPTVINSNVSLSPGAAALTLGNANMRWSVVITYLTELELNLRARQ